MPRTRATTVAEYIAAAPPEGRKHLRRLYAILRGAAPKADAIIKWGNPFFVEPRFLFAFSAHTSHLSFAPTSEALELFSDSLKEYETTKHFLKIRYDQRLPESTIRKIARHRVQAVRARTDKSFW